MAGWIGPAISAGANIIGGIFNRNAAKDANAQTVAAQQRQMDMQEQFAKQGIRWRVNDAKKAGIHPLFALGAQVPTYTPQSTSFAADNSIGNALSAAGQDVGRAINATRTAGERDDAYTTSLKALTLKNAELDLDIKRATFASAVQRLTQNANPPIPTDGPLPWAKQDGVTPLTADSSLLHLDKGWSDGSKFEDRWGEWGGAAAGLAVMAADLINHNRFKREALQRRYPINFNSRGSFREMSVPLLNRY